VCQTISNHSAVSAVVVFTGCRILRFLSRNDDNDVAITAQGGIAAILAGMRAHQDHEGVITAMDTFRACRQLQIYACCALRNLAESAGNQIKIQKTGGIERIVAAASAPPMTVTPASESLGDTLNRRAHDALHRLARNTENKAKILALYVLLSAAATEGKEEEEEEDGLEEEEEEE
jgi:hypothetical protein